MIVATLLFATLAAARTEAYPFPEGHWRPLPPQELAKWWKPALQDLARYRKFIDTSALMVVWHGEVVLQAGDVAHKFMVHSMRKSLLNALIGIAAGNGKIRLDATLSQLAIDDRPNPLSAFEKTATVKDLLESRSGVYHPAALETPDMVVGRPARNSHPPGTFWFYNNWDFNVLGAIYERQTLAKIFESFRDEIAAKIGMEDFRAGDGEYAEGPESVYPGYPLRMSSRDLARFGLLYLRRGRWAHSQLIPAAWIDESTRPHSDAGAIGAYGYLWWIATKAKSGPFAGVPVGTYFAWGYRGHYVAAIPSLDLVIVHRTDTDLDETEVTHREFGRLLRLIVRACPKQKR